MRRRLLPLLFAFSCILLGTPAIAEAPMPKTGSFAFSGGEEEIAKMEATVDEIVEDLNMFLRPIARPRLRSECAPWDTVVIKTDGSDIAVAINGKTVNAPLDKKVQVKNDLTILRTMRGNVLVEEYVGKKGGRTNEYHPNGAGLRVKSKIWAPQLPRPIHFEYTYK